MEKFIIEGGAPLSGTLIPAGNKNAALPALAATLLTADEVVLRNVPRIRDVDDVARGHPVAAQRHTHAHAGRDVEPRRHPVLEEPVELRQPRVDDDAGEPGSLGRHRGQSPAAARSSSTRSSRSQVKPGSSRPKWP